MRLIAAAYGSPRVRCRHRRSRPRANHGKRGAALPAEVEQFGHRSCRVLLPLRVGVEPVEHGLAAADVVEHAVQGARHRLRLDMAVVRQQRVDVGERHVRVVSAVVPRQQQVAEAFECRVVQQVSQAASNAQMTARPASRRSPSPVHKRARTRATTQPRRSRHRRRVDEFRRRASHVEAARVTPQGAFMANSLATSMKRRKGPERSPGSGSRERSQALSARTLRGRA